MKYAVKINSKHIDPRNENKMSPKELFLFAQMKSRVSYFGNLDTTIDMLSCFVSFKSRKSDNKKEIKSIISNLVQKGVIVVDQQEEYLRITFPHIGGNYDLIPMEILEKAMNPHEFMLLVYIYRFDHMNGECLLSYSRIMELLETSRGKAFDIVEELLMKGMIHKKSGERLQDSKRQEMNKYQVAFVKAPSEVVLHVEPLDAVSDSSEPSQEPQETNLPQEPHTAPGTVSETFRKETKKEEPSQDLPQDQEKTPISGPDYFAMLEKEKKDDQPREKKLERPQEPNLEGLPAFVKKAKMKKYEKDLGKYERDLRAEQGTTVELVF
ncbi:hypothetical protein [Jeotgalibacillus haloalkalitolerans]|uniref:DnaD domain-containing protein n=1 Tax=Jeotgalibacillus haloalkalitolerans TaxID=3104292 RepID=A0ABU5KPW4_9BACL|nr:hypothetical protein [Jeotgalibacillus sp. HH7-29]MDZ5712786.1 hypothetical protein [Jeotgalibacillus sp. HH7-29]